MAVTSALEIIDAEGLSSFSLHRLAHELGVRTPSLYYHFSDKSEILTEVARRIAAIFPVPESQYTPGPDWVESIISICMALRASILRHPNAAPLLLEFLPRDLLVDSYEAGARLLDDSGVPAAVQVCILDGAERITLGAALTEAMRGKSTRKTIFPDVDATTQPTLARALAANRLSTHEIFEVGLRAFLDGVASDLVKR
ncbi:TetR/AcrR family transcriptional regulator C-terminal domain-containing protein [Mycobacterium syngnathidarum]